MRAAMQFWRMPWSTLAGVALGVLGVMAVPEWVTPIRDAYDAQFPVLRMRGTVVERDADSVVLHIRGEKLRGEECRLMSVYGYAVDAAGRLHDATATRTDQPEINRQRDRGSYDIGYWRVRPVGPGSVAVKVMTAHDCVGRIVLSTIAEAAL